MTLTPMPRAHTDALLARLRADTGLSGVVFEGVVTDRPARYCTVFADQGRHESERLDERQIQSAYRYVIHSIGSTPEQARWVGERVFAQLFDWRPVIPGRTCWRARHVGGQAMQIDRDVSPPLWFVVDEFELRSTPA